MTLTKKIAALAAFALALGCASAPQQKGLAAFPTFPGTSGGGGGGGSSTVSTSAPVSGDGSVGNPVTLAAGSVGTTSLAAGAVTTAKLATTAVTAGSYAGATLTVGADGRLTAASGSKLATYLTSWYDARIAEQLALVPQLTRCKPIYVGGIPAGSSSGGVTNATVGEGGQVSAGAGVVGQMTGTVFMTPKSGKWGVSFRAVYATPVTTHHGRIGIINGAHTHLVGMTDNFDQDNTHFVLEILGASSTLVTASGTGSVISNGTAVDITLTGDGTTITGMVNGNTVVTTTNLTNLSDEPMAVMQLSTVANEAYPLDAVYCYVAP